MNGASSEQLNIGPRLMLAFAALIALIGVGNGLVIWEFQAARIQTERLAGANEQLAAVLQLQVSLLSFHRQLDDLAWSRDARRLLSEGDPIRRALLEQARQARAAIAGLPAATRVDPSFLPMLESIEVTLPAQVGAINELAQSGDWATVQSRLGNELKPIETQTSLLVDRIDRQARSELSQALAGMRRAQNGILVIVPATALSTFCLAAFLAWSGAHRINELRLDARVAERTRIARELHDTLLQSFQGVLLRFQAASIILADRPAEAQRELERAIEEAAKAITEGRNAVQDLRSAPTIADDFAAAIATLGKELAATPNNAPSTAPASIDVVVEGTPRQLNPATRDDVYRIAGEAVRNAFRHARARRIEVDVHYDQERLRVRVRDDGAGIEPAVLVRDRPGHFGLRGMRERAALIGGHLDLWSESGLGTEIELTIPAGTAYAGVDTRRRPVRHTLRG
jgi:signal transduction histidine kinase